MPLLIGSIEPITGPFLTLPVVCLSLMNKSALFLMPNITENPGVTTPATYTTFSGTGCHAFWKLCNTLGILLSRTITEEDLLLAEGFIQEIVEVCISVPSSTLIRTQLQSYAAETLRPNHESSDE